MFTPIVQYNTTMQIYHQNSQFLESDPGFK